MSYIAKTAYKGSISANYEEDRIVEDIWTIEHNWLAETLEAFPTGIEILDIPVGTGRFFPLYEARDCQVYGFDISPDMIRESLRKLDGREVNYVIQTADAEAIPLAESSVDLIVCFRLFHLVPFPIIKKILKEFHRVGSSDIIIEIFDSSFRNPVKISWLDRVRSKLATALRTRKTRRPNLKSDYKPWSSIQNFTYARTDFERELIRAGFKIKSTTPLVDSDNPATVYWLEK